MIKKGQLRRISILLVFLFVILLGYQNCGDVRLKGFDGPPPEVKVAPTPPLIPPPLGTPNPGEVPTPAPSPGAPAPGPSPSVVDGGTSTGAVNLGLDLIFHTFDHVEWSPTGHFIITGNCAAAHSLGVGGWPGGQYLFDRNGNYLAMSHVCRESGFSGACPDGGCNLGTEIAFVSPDTFVRFAQQWDTPGDQRAPMLYKIQNNRMIYKGQLFTPKRINTVDENYPNDYYGLNGTVVGDTLILLKSKGRDPEVPARPNNPQEPYRQIFYRVNVNSVTNPFELLMEWPDFQPQTIHAIYSVGPMVLTAYGSVYRFANNNFTFVKELVPESAVYGYRLDVIKDSTDTNVFYLRPRLAQNNLRKYRYQDNTIVDLGEIVAGPHERVITASGNIVLKWKLYDNDPPNCPQRSEMIVEVNGQKIPMVQPTWDSNQFSNEICARPNACPANQPPLPVPGPHCRSEGLKAAGISPDGVILYEEKITQRIRKIKVSNF